MKKILSFLCAASLIAAVFCLLPTSVFASEMTGSCGDNVTYVYDTETKVLTLSGTGSTKDYAGYGANKYLFGSNSTMKLATSVVVGEGITRLGDYVLYGLSKVTSVSLPSTLTEIGPRAFGGMNLMTGIELNEGLESIGEYAFQSWRSLSSLSFPSTLTYIGNSAFSGCSNVPTLVVPGNVKTVSTYAFNGWSALTSLTIENGVETIGSQAFGGTQLTAVDIPASVTSLTFNSFDGNNQLAAYNVDPANPNYCDVNGVLYSKDMKTLLRCPDAYTGAYEIAEGCETISPSSFQNCFGVTAITIPEGVTYIGANAFQGTSITTLTLPGTVAYLESGVFYGCDTVENVIVNGTMTELPQNSFNGCYSLKTVVLSPSITTLGSGAFSYCSALETVTIPGALTAIPSDCFNGCSSLTGFAIPDTVTSIGSNAFYNCVGITEAALPEGLTELGGFAFFGTSIQTVTVPAGVTFINGSVFARCNNLTEIDFLGEITYVSTNAAANCPNLVKVTFHCPAPDPKNANESAFQNVNKDFEIHYPNIYPEWEETRPFDGKYSQYVYVADLYATDVRMTGVELRERETADGMADIRFIAKVTPVDKSYVVNRYVVLTSENTGMTVTVMCRRIWHVDPDGTQYFTAVLTNVPAEHFDKNVSAQAFLTLNGKWEGVMRSNVVSACVNDLMGQD